MNNLPANLTTQAMPSVFNTLRSTQSQPLKSFIDIAYYIMSDSYTRIQTESYRDAVKVDRQYSANIKRNSHAICPSIQFKPKGRTLEAFQAETLILMLDYDHVIGLVMQDALEAVKNSPHTMVAYRTISGMGFRVLLRYERPKGCTLTATELHRLAITKAINLYDGLTRLSADKQCLDMTRLCGLAHDEQAYFNWNAPALPITPEEVEHFYKTQVKPKLDGGQAKSVDGDGNGIGYRDGNGNNRSYQRNDSRNGKRESGDGTTPSKPASFDDIIATVKRHAKGWDCQFVPGSHHQYALRFASFCHRYGADKDSLLTWMSAEMGAEHEGVGDIVDWVYSKPDSFGSWHLYAPGEGYGRNPSMNAIKQWIESRSELRFNIMTHKNEIRAYNTKDKFFYKWTAIGEREEDTLYTIMDMSGLRTSKRKLHSFLNSHFSQDFNPLVEYLKTLAAWNEEKDPDHIGELADTISVLHAPEYYHTHELFKYAFKKWFVAMVAGWITKKNVNETMLLLVGKGGIYKTTFLEHLLPPCLHDYFTNDSTADYNNKDFLEYFSSKALICLDEFATPQGKNLNSFKSCVTKKELNVRYPYDRYASVLIHNASLCGTSNNLHIVDELENRRYLIWQVTSIVSPLSRPINYEGIYSQALAMSKKVLEAKGKKDLEDEWVYWLTTEDRAKQEIHNSMFMVNNYLDELIKKYYRVPESTDRSNPNLKFVTAADIIDKISTNAVFRQTLSNKDVSITMNRLGFTKQHRRNGNGWWVIEKEGLVINLEAGFGYEPEDRLAVFTNQEETETEDGND